MPSDDRDLLEGAGRGDRRSFDELMRRHEQRVFALSLRMLGNRSDALDATQDTFVKVLRSAGSFHGDSAFTTWLYRIAANVAKDALRKRLRTAQPEDDDTVGSLQSPGAGVEETAGLRVDLQRALASLPEDYRTAIVLADLCGLPYDEVAAIAGVPVGTIKSRISRGRKQLARTLEPPRRPPASKENA